METFFDEIGNSYDAIPHETDVTKLHTFRIHNIKKVIDLGIYPNKAFELNVKIKDIFQHDAYYKLDFLYGVDELNKSKTVMIYTIPKYYYQVEDEFKDLFEIGIFNSGNHNVTKLFDTDMVETPQKFLDLVIEVLSESINNDIPF